MKLPLRYFILACLLLGAIGLPWAWRTYLANREAEIERLEKELEDEKWNLTMSGFPSGSTDSLSATPTRIKTQIRTLERMKAINDRLEELTNKPRRHITSEVDAVRRRLESKLRLIQ